MRTRLSPTRYVDELERSFACPFCGGWMIVNIEIGIVNHRAAHGKRVTRISSRRVNAHEHLCIDPTRSQAEERRERRERRGK